MDFLKQLLGDKYKEGMTEQEIGEALQGMNLANLSTGEYVRKGKAEADQKSLQSQIAQLQSQLKGKMSDEELAENKLQELTNSNQALAQQIVEMRKNANKAVLENALAGTVKRLNLDTKSENYSNFINSLVREDEVENANVAKFFGDILEQSYSKGAEMKERQVTGSQEFKNNPSPKQPENIGARLGKEMGTSTKVNNPYFKED